MSNKNSDILENTLSKKNLHELWVKTYYSGRNLKFYDYAFDKILKTIGLKKDSKILDAGCGNGVHSIRLADRGFSVTSIDFSSEALKLAEDKIIEKGFESQITLKKDNLLSLSFSSSNFETILCWGVLMHVPDIAKALSELVRVLKKDGYLILSENNKSSVQTYFAKKWKSKNSKERIEVDSSGICFWSDTEAGNFMVRKTDIKWLIQYLNSKGLKLVKRFPGQFTSLYTRTNSNTTKNLIYLFNEVWFRFIKNSALSEGNILLFIKQN